MATRRTVARRWRVAGIVSLLVLGFALVAHALERPPALQQQGGCELWHGLIAGNDPSAIEELQICDDGGGAFHGTVQHSSRRAGFGIRSMQGHLEHGTHYVFHDVAFIQNQPASDWRFCLVDHYTLDRVTPTHLSGTYLATGCDHGTVELDLVAHGDGRTGLEPPGTPGPGPTPAPSMPLPVVPTPLPPTPVPRPAFGCGT